MLKALGILKLEYGLLSSVWISKIVRLEIESPLGNGSIAASLIDRVKSRCQALARGTLQARYATESHKPLRLQSICIFTIEVSIILRIIIYAYVLTRR